jgi:MFS family permease
MWPGTFSLTSAVYPKGGTAMFGTLAILGDVGCSVGPALMGVVSTAVAQNPQVLAQSSIQPEQLSLKVGMLFCVIFPLVIIFGVALMRRFIKHEAQSAARK